MTEPDFTPLGERYYERVSPLQPPEVDEQHDHAFGNLAEAMMRPYKQVAELIDPPDPYEPWSPLFFVDITPDWALQWLGQVVGVRVPNTATPSQARAMIKELSFEEVGKPETIKNVIRAYLGGSKSIIYRERDGNAYRLEIITMNRDAPVQEQDNLATDPSFNQMSNLWDGDAGVPGNYYHGGWEGGADVTYSQDASWSVSGPNSLLASGTTVPSFFKSLAVKRVDVNDPVLDGTKNFFIPAKRDSYYTVRAIIRVNNEVPGLLGKIDWGWHKADGSGYGGDGDNPLDTKWYKNDLSKPGVYQLVQVIHTNSLNQFAGFSCGLRFKIGPKERDEYVGQGGPLPAIGFEVDINFGGIDIRHAARTDVTDADVPPYRDGEHPDWSWDGAAFASVSSFSGEGILAKVLGPNGGVVPAGIKVTYRSIDTWDYQSMTDEFGPYTELEGEFVDYRRMTMNERA
jgi:hypothetical protein